MRLGNLLLLLPFAAASAVPSSKPKSCPPDKCIFNPVCTVEMEQMYHIKLLYNRKEGITPEEFNQYWAYNHVKIVTPFHMRLGVHRYSQYHSTPEFRDLGRVPGAPPIIDFDGAAEFWVPNIETFYAMGTDSEYLNVIQPDEAHFIDGASLRMLIGVDFVVVENQNVVTKHGRQF